MAVKKVGFGGYQRKRALDDAGKVRRGRKLDKASDRDPKTI